MNAAGQARPHLADKPPGHVQKASILGLLLVGVVLAGCFQAPQADDHDDEIPGPLARPPFSESATLGTTRLYTAVEDPGYPEGIVVHGDRLYVSSAAFAEAGIVLEYNLTTAELLRTIEFEPPDDVRGWERGALGLASDAQGRIYAAELIGGRIVRFDPRADDLDQVTYGEIPDLPPCTQDPVGPCAPTREPQPPVPNYIAFGPDGALYVTDTYQHTIWRIPPGGGDPAAWYQDPRFETAQFGMNGMAFGPGDDHLYIAQSILGVAAPEQTVPAGAAVWRLPFTENPTPGDLELFHEYPAALIDGIKFAASGRLYVTVLGIALQGVAASHHGISILDPGGEEESFFPAPAENEAQDIPYNGPASIAFHDDHRSILVTNLAQSNPDHWAVLEAFVDETGLPLHRPDGPD